jgi:hypothetical protein
MLLANIRSRHSADILGLLLHLRYADRRLWNKTCGRKSGHSITAPFCRSRSIMKRQTPTCFDIANLFFCALGPPILRLASLGLLLSGSSVILSVAEQEAPIRESR